MPLSARAGLAALLLSVPAVLLAQDLPPVKELAALVEGAVPGFWQVGAFRVIATSDQGDAAAPRRFVRFEADVAADEALFVQTSIEGPFALVAPALPAGETRTLYGVMDLGYRAGVWSGPVTLENSVEGLGQPLSSFTQPTLELGSETAMATLAALRSEALAAEAAASERAIAERRATYEAAMASLEAEQMAELQRTRRDHAQAIGTLQTEQGVVGEASVVALAALQSEQAAALDAVRRQHGQDLATAEAEFNATLTALTEGKGALVAAARAQLAAEQTAEIETLTAAHAAARGQLIATQRQAIAELETGLATERQSLERQLESALDVIALQQSLTAALIERSAGSDALLAAFEAARRAKQEFFARLPTEWIGTVMCADTAGNGPYKEWSTKTDFSIESIQSEGMIVRLGKPYGGDAIFSVIGESFTFPLEFDVVWFEVRYNTGLYDSFRMVISQDGQMTGSSAFDLNQDGRTTNVTCNFRFSS